MSDGVVVLAATRGGARLGGEIAAALGADAELHVTSRWHAEAPAGAVRIEGRLAAHVVAVYRRARGLVFVLASGAVIRLVAPLLGHKRDDPAVLSVDERGLHVVALLGGHQALANALAATIADAIGADPVISTASDVLELPALDLLGHSEGWRIEASTETLTRASAAVVAGERVGIFQDAGSCRPLDDLPPEWPRLGSLDELRAFPGVRLAVTDRGLGAFSPADGYPTIVYRPPTLVLGVGCSLGAPADELDELSQAALAEAGLAPASVGLVATIDRRLQEPGVVELARRLGVGLVGYPAEQLAAVTGLPTPSAEVQRHVGTPGVCEPAALLASDGGRLVVPKRRSAHATVAVARRAPRSGRPGKLWLVGLGPGTPDLMTGRARRALRQADVVVGYRGYLEQLARLVSARRCRPYALGQERERASEAIALARSGREVALVSSGDIGVYGMAGLVFELLGEEERDGRRTELEVEVIPGVTAASSAAALLGAPLMLDFAAISLSDLLVPWEAIRQRLRAVAEGDLVCVLYNPASARRRRPFEEALAIMREHRAPDTPVGLVREAYRPDQRILQTTLGDLSIEQVDMRTVVVVGCSRTTMLAGRMVTRRGYLERAR